MLVDDVLVFRGSLLPSPALWELPLSAATSSFSAAEPGTLDWGTRDQPCLRQSLLFSDDPQLLQSESSRIPLVREEISCFDEGRQLPPLLLLAQGANSNVSSPKTTVRAGSSRGSGRVGGHKPFPQFVTASQTLAQQQQTLSQLQRPMTSVSNAPRHGKNSS